LTDQPLDLSLLESMFGDDAELRQAILDEFANSATPYLCELDQALAEKSAEGVKTLAHKLKSSSRTVGAGNLADICEVLEAAAPNQDWQELNRLSETLREALDQVIVFIRSLG
jgi:HPt (histidine-containing phosphotransfer) domain-containing protein